MLTITKSFLSFFFIEATTFLSKLKQAFFLILQNRIPTIVTMTVITARMMTMTAIVEELDGIGSSHSVSLKITRAVVPKSLVYAEYSASSRVRAL